MDKVIVKYRIDGHFVENDYYSILFDWDKCTVAYSYDNNKKIAMSTGTTGRRALNVQLPIDYLKKYNGHYMQVKSAGDSPDGSKIFIINILDLERNIKIKNILGIEDKKYRYPNYNKIKKSLIEFDPESKQLDFIYERDIDRYIDNF